MRPSMPPDNFEKHDRLIRLMRELALFQANPRGLTSAQSRERVRAGGVAAVHRTDPGRALPVLDRVRREAPRTAELQDRPDLRGRRPGRSVLAAAGLIAPQAAGPRVGDLDVGPPGRGGASF